MDSCNMCSSAELWDCFIFCVNDRSDYRPQIQRLVRRSWASIAPSMQAPQVTSTRGNLRAVIMIRRATTSLEDSGGTTVPVFVHFRGSWYPRTQETHTLSGWKLPIFNHIAGSSGRCGAQATFPFRPRFNTNLAAIDKSRVRKDPNITV